MLTSDAIGGVWTYTLSLAGGLVDSGCVCTIVLLGPAATLQQNEDAAARGVGLIDSHLELDWLCRQPADVVRTSVELARIAQQLGVDLVHLHTPVFAAADWMMPVVAVAHSCTATWWEAVHGGEMPPAFRWRKEGMRRGLAAAHAVIAPSHAFAAALDTVYGGIETLSVIYNGVATRRFSPPVSSRSGQVMSVGRLWDAGKNMMTLDAAAALQSHPVTIAGSVSGPDGSTFEGCHVTAPGVLANELLLEAYRKTAIFAAPSVYEPFGLAVLEAASTGAPLLLADIPTFRELWEDAAVFVPPRDSFAWADAIATLMMNEDKRAYLGEAASRRSLRYQQQVMVSQTRSLHDIVLARTASNDLGT